jgi:hypothetical protein
MNKSREQIVEQVLHQMRKDMINHDLTAIQELLEVVPIENLIGYLPEEDQ